ncbi:hypothetical protein PybrP1_007234 [[Pythium] brassicae (nom. inval.)]|nr:hypothetical protein PybrP1_007234 [[Pythium] brassicae (nom. inval.)]
MKRKAGVLRGGRGASDSAAVTLSTSGAAVAEERTRDTTKLFAHRETLRCAETTRCRACCYKIVLFGRAGLLPNVRPELCPRMAAAADSTLSNTSDVSQSIGLYDSQHVRRILIVGDGNFSFSLALANAFHAAADDAQTRVELVATSHESRDTVLETYPDGARILEELHAMPAHVTVLHEVDATDAAQMQALGKFDRVLWNFPCVRAPRGEDGQNQEMELNKKLLADFFAHVGELLTATGEVHVTHKTKAPFGQWGIESIAETHGLRHAHSVVFDRCLYPGYSNKKVLSKGSFPIWDSLTFVFVPASRPEAAEGPDAASDDAARVIEPIVRVTPDVLRTMYLLLSPTIQDRLDAGSKHKKRKPNKPSPAVDVGVEASGKSAAPTPAGAKPKQSTAGKNGSQASEKRKRPPQPPGKFGHHKKQKLRKRK